LSIFDTVTSEDNKILTQLDEVKHEHQKILDLFAKRVALYKKCAEQTHDPIERAIIEAKKMVIMSDMGLLATQYDIQSEIGKINSRLDALERVSHSQDRKTS
jgi:uncharacterized protein YicC (UPF0701 family)